MRTRGIALIALLLLPAAEARSQRPSSEAPDLPLPEAHLSLVARSPDGPWVLRLSNDGDHRLRVDADVRLLSLTVHPADGAPVHCALPRPLRPEMLPPDRALFLDPGQAYVESFDPELFCFGKQTAALAPDALVEATYGLSRDPFVVSDVAFPPEVRPLRSLSAPPFGLGRRTDTAPPIPIEGERSLADENAPRLAIASEPFVEAASPHTAVVSITVTNVGHRPGSALLRSELVGFQVRGPDGFVTCSPPPPPDAASPENLTTLAPGASRTLQVRVREACGGLALERPGLYRLLPTFRIAGSIRAPGLEPPAAVTVRPRPTALRLLTGPRPFYKTGPIAVPANQP
jgi:hypothetical protein